MGNKAMSMSEIYRAERRDAEDVCRIVRSTILQVYPRHYSQAVVDEFIKGNDPQTILADIDRGCVYYIRCGVSAVGTVTVRSDLISRLYVLPLYQGRGFGEALLDASFSRIYTETNITVTAAGNATADFLIAIARRSSSKTIEFEKVFRFANMTVTVNEKAVEAAEEEPEGVTVLAEDKRVNGWALGSDYLALDGGYWEYADETGAHPSLIPFWAPEEGEEGSGEEGSGESGEEGSGEEGSGESGETA